MSEERPEQDEPNRAPGAPAFYDDLEEDGPAPAGEDDENDEDAEPADAA